MSVPPCNWIAFRVVTKLEGFNFESGIIETAAFLRRNPVDDDGLSLRNPAEHQQLELPIIAEEVSGNFNRPKAVVSLHVGRMLDAGLVIEQDDDPDHLIITNLPYPDDDPGSAEHWAGILRDMARIQWVKPKK